jgi:4-hydroxy-tetrahydrodipicolinate reductase
VVLDFTAPAASVPLSELAAQARIVHVIGTTGFSEDDLARLRASARHAVIVKSGNMSLGVNLLAALVREAAKALPNYDIEIVENASPHEGGCAFRDRACCLARPPPKDGTFGCRITSCGRATAKQGHVRTAPLVLPRCVAARSWATHTVTLAGPFERIELTHRAEDRMIFARGAVAAGPLGPG